MLINIIDFKSEEKGKETISFKSPYGDARAFWKGSTPILSKDYEVELDLNEVFISEDNIIHSNIEKYFIDHNGSYFIINGKIESLINEDLASIRLGDSLFLVSYKGVIGKEGDYITLKVKELFVFDTNI